MEGAETFTLSYMDFDYKEESKALLEDLRKIQSTTLLLNEDNNGGDNNNNNNNNNNNGDSGGNNNIDADLDALLKDSGGNNNAGGNDNSNNAGSNDNQSLNDIPDLSSTDNESGDNSNNNADAPAENTDSENKSGDSTNFETDSQGLVDAIQKLTKSGHTVKIVVQAENKNYYPIDVKNLTPTMLGETRNMYFSLNNKNITPKILIEAANRLSTKGGNRMSNETRAIFNELRNIRREFNLMKNSNSLHESKINDDVIMVKESDYETLTEMVENLANKLEEQEALIKNYESLNEFNLIDESSDLSEINDLLIELDESTNQLNKLTNSSKLNRQHNISFATGIDNTFKSIQEHVLPTLTELNEAKGAILSAMDSVYIDNYASEYIDSINESLNMYYDVDEDTIFDIQNEQLNIEAAYDDMNDLDESLEILKRINSIDRVSAIFENRINNSTLSQTQKNEMLSILSEASGDICLAPKDSDYENSYPEYQYFSKEVYKNILGSVANVGGKSDISAYNNDNSDMLTNTIKKSELPIMAPEKWNVTPTVKSAIVQLTEGLTNIDGEFNIPLCEQAFLYKKVKKPASIKDFAMPIAVFDEGKLYAHPTLIKSTANILASDKCMKTYNIPSREELYTLRENLMPYLNAIGESAPWLENKDN